MPCSPPQRRAHHLLDVLVLDRHLVEVGRPSSARRAIASSPFHGRGPTSGACSRCPSCGSRAAARARSRGARPSFSTSVISADARAPRARARSRAGARRRRVARCADPRRPGSSSGVVVGRADHAVLVPRAAVGVLEDARSACSGPATGAAPTGRRSAAAASAARRPARARRPAGCPTSGPWCRRRASGRPRSVVPA